MKKLFAVALMAVLAGGLLASSHDTGITPEMMTKISAAYKADSHQRFVYNALAGTSAVDLVRDQQKINELDSYFSHRIKGEKISDQKSTGRCWMFAGLNILRPFARKNLNIKDIEFSQNFLFFFDKLEKSNLFLEGIIKTRNRPLNDRYVEFLMKNTMQDGGQWVGVKELIEKYGVVPKDIMPETYSSSHSRTLNRTLARRLKIYALAMRQEKKSLKKLRTLKLRALQDVYRILAVNLGVPPKSFSWRYKDKDGKITAPRTYTPRQFYTRAVNENLNDYYALYSIPTRPFRKLFQIELDQAVYDRPTFTFANCSIETLKDIARKSILDNTPVWFGCDVGKDSFSKKGLMIPDMLDLKSIYGMDFKMSRKEMFLTYSSVPTHAMVFTGVDMIGERTVKWLVENSWGGDWGNQGYYYMQDKWFDFYVQEIVVHKKYIPENILAVFKTRATVLPPWDPMFQTVN